MECPECNKELKLPVNTQLNMEYYHNPCLSITECCGKLVKVYPKTVFDVVKYQGNKLVDDWNREPKK